VQRIKGATIQAKAEGREVRDGESQPACAQAGGARGRVVGAVNDPDSAVSRLSRSPRGTLLLEDLGTRPGVVYLSRQTTQV
jgi:Fe-S-cluster-containing dehydrogenase component